MYILFSVLVLLACALLVLLIVIQNSKGGGLASNFQSVSQASQIWGSRRTAEGVERLTWVFAGVIGGLALVINMFFLSPSAEEGGSKLKSKAAVESAGPAQAAPAQNNQNFQDLQKEQGAAPAGGEQK